MFKTKISIGSTRDFSSLLLFGMMLMILLFMNGCGDEPPSPSPLPVKKVEGEPKAKGEPVPAMEEKAEPEPPAYVYSPSGRRDPFEPSTEIPKSVIKRTEPLTPLQKFEVDQMKLIAVIIGKGEPRAMIVAPDGKSYILKKGIKIGKNDGTVVGIEPESVLVEERYYDFSGDIRTSIKEITLPRRGGAE